MRLCSLRELEPGRGVAGLVDGQQVALFLLPGTGDEASRLRAVDNRDPASGANVLSRGLLGRTGDVDYVASPMHKHRFDLATGQCLEPETPAVRVWPVRVWGSTVEVLSVSPVPPPLVVDTHCPYCALQCGMGLRPGGPPGVEVVPRRDFDVTEGRMCVKGWSAAELLRHPDRLRVPLVRDARGRLREASWEVALDDLADRLGRLRHSYGADSVGVFGSGALTNEKAYLLGKFARVAIGTAHVDYNGRFCMASAAAAQNRVLGIDRGLPFPLSDIAGTGSLVLWGANPAETMPPLMMWVERMQRAGGRLIVVDPRRTPTAAVADRHIQPVPGTDLAVALGLLHLVDALGLADETYLATRTTGWDAVRASVKEWTPARVEEISGVPAGQLRQLAETLGGPRPAMLLTGRGPEQQSKGTDTVTALIGLMLALGHVGRPASGYGCLTGQANGQGGREHGQKADQLPGYRDVSDPADREAVAAVWGVDPSLIPGPGMPAVEMLQSIGRPDGIRGLLVAGSNLGVAAPDAGRTLKRLAGLDLLAVLDSFPSDTTDTADFVLPTTQWAEEDGTVTNLEGRVLRRRRAISPPDGSRSDIEILCGLASRLGRPAGFGFSSPEEVFDELRRASTGGRADYSGISYGRLDAGETLYWPCREPSDPGTPRLFTDRFAHPDGRAHLAPVAYRPPAETPDPAFPLYFTTGRWREHYNSGNQTRRVSRLGDARPEPTLQMHPDLARRLGVDDGAAVVVESRRGCGRFRAWIDGGIRPDSVFAPFHWGGRQCANLLTLDAVDPISRMPEFKVCAVRVTPER